MVIPPPLMPFPPDSMSSCRTRLLPRDVIEMDKDGRYVTIYLICGMISAWLFIWIGVSATNPIRWALSSSWVAYIFFVGAITYICIGEFWSKWGKKSEEYQERIRILERREKKIPEPKPQSYYDNLAKGIQDYKKSD